MGSNIATNYITCPGDPKKTVGTRFSSTSQTSPVVHMVQTTLRRCRSSSMQTAASAGFTSLTACTARRSCHQNSNSSFRYRRASEAVKTRAEHLRRVSSLCLPQS